MIRPVFCWFGLLVLVTGCQPPTGSDPVADREERSATAREVIGPLEKGEMRYETMLLSDGTTLRYSIWLPPGFRSDQPTPLIWALHFGGPMTPFVGGGMVELLIEPGLGELNAMIVAPDALEPGWGAEPNRRAMEELWQQIQADWQIDRDRTLVTGFSMGGHGTWLVAAQHSDWFRAAIPIAGRGLDAGDRPAEGWPMPFYVIHSNADKVVPIEPTKKWVNQVENAGGQVTFVEVDGIPHFETYRFAEPLKEAVPWVQKIWGDRD